MNRWTAHFKLLVGAAILAGATGYLAYLGATSSWQYYLLVDECVEGRAELSGKRVRVNGRVAATSLQIRDDRRLAQFTLAGDRQVLAVTCRGPLPDNLAEEIDVVVEGTLEADGSLRGDKLLTKCASKYEAEQTVLVDAARRGVSRR